MEASHRDPCASVRSVHLRSLGVHPCPTITSVHTTTMITVQLTAAEIAAFTAALERAVDCPFIAEDDCAADLERLLGTLEGAADAA